MFQDDGTEYFRWTLTCTTRTDWSSSAPRQLLSEVHFESPSSLPLISHWKLVETSPSHASCGCGLRGFNAFRKSIRRPRRIYQTELTIASNSHSCAQCCPGNQAWEFGTFLSKVVSEKLSFLLGSGEIPFLCCWWHEWNKKCCYLNFLLNEFSFVLLVYYVY